MSAGTKAPGTVGIQTGMHNGSESSSSKLDALWSFKDDGGAEEEAWNEDDEDQFMSIPAGRRKQANEQYGNVSIPAVSTTKVAACAGESTSSQCKERAPSIKQLKKMKQHAEKDKNNNGPQISGSALSQGNGQIDSHKGAEDVGQSRSVQGSSSRTSLTGKGQSSSSTKQSHKYQQQATYRNYEKEIGDESEEQQNKIEKRERWGPSKSNTKMETVHNDSSFFTAAPASNKKNDQMSPAIGGHSHEQQKSRNNRRNNTNNSTDSSKLTDSMSLPFSHEVLTEKFTKNNPAYGCGFFTHETEEQISNQRFNHDYAAFNPSNNYCKQLESEHLANKQSRHSLPQDNQSNAGKWNSRSFEKNVNYVDGKSSKTRPRFDDEVRNNGSNRPNAAGEPAHHRSDDSCFAEVNQLEEFPEVDLFPPSNSSGQGNRHEGHNQAADNERSLSTDYRSSWPTKEPQAEVNVGYAFGENRGRRGFSDRRDFGYRGSRGGYIEQSGGFRERGGLNDTNSGGYQGRGGRGYNDGGGRGRGRGWGGHGGQRERGVDRRCSFQDARTAKNETFFAVAVSEEEEDWENPVGNSASSKTSVAAWGKLQQEEASESLRSTTTGKKWKALEPGENVWKSRQEFYQSALPRDIGEEERMLADALEMSRLQDEQDALAMRLETETQRRQAEDAALDNVLRASAITEYRAPSSVALPPAVSDSDCASRHSSTTAPVVTVFQTPPHWNDDDRESEDNVNVVSFSNNWGSSHVSGSPFKDGVNRHVSDVESTVDICDMSTAFKSVVNVCEVERRSYSPPALIVAAQTCAPNSPSKASYQQLRDMSLRAEYPQEPHQPELVVSSGSTAIKYYNDESACSAEGTSFFADQIEGYSASDQYDSSVDFYCDESLFKNCNECTPSESNSCSNENVTFSRPVRNGTDASASRTTISRQVKTATVSCASLLDNRSVVRSQDDEDDKMNMHSEMRFPRPVPIISPVTTICNIISDSALGPCNIQPSIDCHVTGDPDQCEDRGILRRDSSSGTSNELRLSQEGVQVADNNGAAEINSMISSQCTPPVSAVSPWESSGAVLPAPLLHYGQFPGYPMFQYPTAAAPYYQCYAPLAAGAPQPLPASQPLNSVNGVEQRPTYSPYQLSLPGSMYAPHHEGTAVGSTQATVAQSMLSFQQSTVTAQPMQRIPVAYPNQLPIGYPQGFVPPMFGYPGVMQHPMYRYAMTPSYPQMWSARDASTSVIGAAPAGYEPYHYGIPSMYFGPPAGYPFPAAIQSQLSPDAGQQLQGQQLLPGQPMFSGQGQQLLPQPQMLVGQQMLPGLGQQQQILPVHGQQQSSGQQMLPVQGQQLASGQQITGESPSWPKPRNIDTQPMVHPSSAQRDNSNQDS